MSRPGVVPAKRRQQPTLDIWAPPPQAVELATNVMRVKARLAQHAADDVMRVKARLAQRAADKASAANVATKRQEDPRVPRVARQQWQHAPTLKSNESSLKAIRHIAPARPDKSRVVQSVQPRNELAGRCLTPRTKDSAFVRPMAPRATRLRAVDVSPLACSLSRTPKVALKGILRGGPSQQKRREKKQVSFGSVETKEVDRWIGVVPGTEPYN